MSCVIHTDKLGSTIFIDAYVAASYGNKLVIGKVIKTTNVMIRVRDVNSAPSAPGRLVYPDETVILNSPDVLAYVLKI